MEYIKSVPNKHVELKRGNLDTYRKSQNHFYQAIKIIGVSADGHIKRFIDVRFYQTRLRKYCCVWLSANQQFGHAGGFACYETDALSIALGKIGVEVHSDIHSGHTSMIDALVELATKMNQDNKSITSFHAIEAYA